MPAKRRPIKKTTKRAKVAPIVLSSDHQEKTEQEKKLAMFAGVGFFMVLVVAGWTINFKNNFKEINNNVNNSGSALSETADQLREVVSETKKQITDLRAALENKGEVAGEKQTADEIKQRIELEKLLFSLNDKLVQATSTKENK
ncbi:MAG: hypothetical protein WCV41_02830 [Patescibacteria group bacterium]